uniref:Putative ATP-dependent Clp protease, Hsp 100, ATP-binding subunit ClpB n=1 Tax=Paulinella chromatophora TaxID=39717 RepID=B1X4D2_PAUCH|nr:putative ATP-dependent Clp protease, Hsp 100, ATP-binding subunit ClpB [Paulinella chromatophora]ACB42801.1 putative ATP-dependent Clp protease, Hsp 100, ATP-binding subunit ClpB [Paulinella chromatophora]
MFKYEQFTRTTLVSDPNHFSEAGWNLLLVAQNVARRWHHCYLDVEHVLEVLFNDSRYVHWIGCLPIDIDAVLDQIEAFSLDQPFNEYNEELFMGDALELLLETSDKYRRKWKSRVLDIPHILHALPSDIRIAKKIFIEIGLSEKMILRNLCKLTIPPIPVLKPRSSFSNTDALSSEQNWVDSAQVKTIPKSSIPTIQIKSKAKSNVPVKTIVKSTVAERGTKLSAPSGIQNTNSNDDLKLERVSSALEDFGRDLTAAARTKLLDPVIGRDGEIRQLIQVLSCRGKNNPVLIGSPGVGKTATVESLAQKIVEGDVPDSLKGLRLIALDLGALIAGAKLRGQFEERFRSVLNEINAPDSSVVLFIDELHTIVSNDRSNLDISSLLKPALARGELRCIGASTPEAYRRTIEKDLALNRLFQQVLIKEPSQDLSIEILRRLKIRYELYHGVTITDAAVIAANRLSSRYISDRCLPDKAIDLIDEAAAQLRIEITSKPRIIKEIEEEIRCLEVAFFESETEPIIDQAQLQRKQDIATQKLVNLEGKWQSEKRHLLSLSRLQEENEHLKYELLQAEQAGDLEKFSRLKYHDAIDIQERRAQTEQALQKIRRSGNSLLKQQVEESDIANIVARWTGIPVQRLLAGERQKLLELEHHLGEKVIGQPEAVFAVAAAIRRARAGMKNPNRPVGSFLFLGPTGVGKTELAKALAAALFDEEEALVRLDMSEFMERNAVARLLGAPPGYVGYEEGGQLTEAVRQRPYAVVLLDEVEKAHPDVFNLLLQVLDDGRLTDSQARTVDFRHTVIVMTSNLAGRAILDRSRKEKSKLADDACEAAVESALLKQFRPEFINRIDEVIRFRPLELVDLQHIARLQLAELGDLLLEQGLRLEISESVVYKLAQQSYEPEYGARPLRRILRRQLENPLATELLEDRFRDATGVRVYSDDINNKEKLIFLPQYS